MEIKCLFETRGASFCSENAFSLAKLSDCRSNIDDQLKRWHLSQHIGFVQEHELILNRSGLPHDLASEQLERLWICEKHRHDKNIHAISGSCPEQTSVEAASRLYSYRESGMYLLKLSLNSLIRKLGKWLKLE